MLQLSHILLLFTNAISFIVIYIAIRLYKEFGSKYLLSNVYLLVGFGIITLSNTIETFLKLTVSDYYYSSISKIFVGTVLFILPLVLVFISYHVFSLISGMLKRNLSRFIKQIAYILVLTLILSQVIFFIKPTLNKIQYFSSAIAHIVFCCSLCLSAVYIFMHSGSMKNRGRQKSLNSFALVLFVFTVFLGLITLGGLFNWTSTNEQMVLLSLVVFLFNVYMVIYIRHFFNKYHTNYMIVSTSKFDTLIEKYNISKREKEIIELLCKGKTNKEIGEELFIAPLTVRDHLYNIFQKTKVKNRLELANLFRE